jgi:hypothetical protein
MHAPDIERGAGAGALVNRAAATLNSRGKEYPKMDLSRTGTRVINALAHRAGYRLVRSGVDDYTGVTRDPLEALYRSEGRPCVVSVPVARLRGAGGFAYAPGNPFVDTLVAYGEGRCHGYQGSPLEAFYEQWQPRTLAESMGLDSSSAGEFLSNEAAFCKVRPWRAGFHQQYFADRLTRKEFRKIQDREGVRGQNIAGTLTFGPVSRSFGEITFKRLTKVFDSIRAQGFRPAAGGEPMRTGVLARLDEWVLVVHSGKHRAAACAAARCKEIPVVLEPLVIRREDAASWPNVRAGLFTIGQARTVFDRWFEGTHPWRESRSRGPSYHMMGTRRVEPCDTEVSPDSRDEEQSSHPR